MSKSEPRLLREEAAASPARFALDGEGPRYRQIYRALRTAILAGELPPESRLPSTRSLAAALGVSRNIVLLAYEQLLAEGYVVGRRGGGTVVAPELAERMLRRKPRADRPEAAPRLAPAGERAQSIFEGNRIAWALRGPRLPYDFRFGRPSFADFPHAVWHRLLARRARAASIRDLDYGAPEGRRELREAIAERGRRTRGLDAHAGNVVVVNGSQQALQLLAGLLLGAGDRVLLEEPHYPGARAVFQIAGAKIVTAPVDRDGLRIEEAPAAKVAYVTPSHQFPTGVVLSLPRRLELLRWAEEHDAFVIEDDYDSEYRYEGPPLQTLQGLSDSRRVIYVGTFSKVLFPSLRLGYLVLPDALVAPVAAAKAFADAGSPTLEQLALADFLREGHFDRHVRRSTVRNAERRAVLLEAIREHFGDEVEVSGANAGLHVLVWLPPDREIDSVQRQAREAGVGVYSVAPYFLKPPERNGLVLGYASLTEKEIREGIRRLADSITPRRSGWPRIRRANGPIR